MNVKMFAESIKTRQGACERVTLDRLQLAKAVGTGGHLLY
jgi:hypothetical protein